MKRFSANALLGLCVAAFWCLGDGAEPAAAQPKPAAEPQRAVELPLVFDDDLSEAPYNRYKTLGPGESEWKAGNWVLKAPAGFVMPAKTDRDAQLSVRMSFPRLAKDGEASETRLGFVYANNQVGVVTFLRKREGEKTVGQVLVLRQPDIVGPVGLTLRKFDLKEDLPSGNWVLQVRAGALTITCDGKEIGRGALETHTVPIIGVAIVQPFGSVTLQRVTLRGTKFPAELSGQQREQGLAAATLNNEVGNLLRAKKYAEAMEKARQVVPMYRKLYGQQHHDVASALFNLGVVLKQGGEKADAVTFLEEALAVRQRLFGADHPDTAQVEMELTVVLVDLKRLEAAFPHCMAAHFSFNSYYGDENRSTILTRQILDKLPPPKKEDET